MVLTTCALLSKYSCPNCNSLNSLDSSKIYDGGFIFICSKCTICGVVKSIEDNDEAYLEFLDMYDNGQISNLRDPESLPGIEKFLRPVCEIDSLLSDNNLKENDLLNTILHSKKDYVVDFRVFKESIPEEGDYIEKLPLDKGIIDSLKARNISRLYKFQEESIKQV